MIHYLLFMPTGMLWNSDAFSQLIIKVSGAEDPLAVKRQVQYYLGYFDIRENVHLTVIYTTILPSHLSGMTFYIDVSDEMDYQVIKVRINARLNTELLAQVLAHEMVHVKQYVKKELHIINQKQVTWKGRKYYCYRHHQLYSRINPWEREAYANETISTVIVFVMKINTFLHTFILDKTSHP